MEWIGRDREIDGEHDKGCVEGVSVDLGNLKRSG